MDKNRDSEEAGVGLGKSGSTEAGYGSTTPAEAVPQYVPATPPTWGSKVLPGVVIALVVLTLVSLYLILSGRKQTAEALSKHADQLNLLTRRLDSSDERYAQLSGRFQVTSEKLGLTEQELQRAHALASSLQRQQRDSVQKLNAAIAQKAGAEELNKLQADASNKFGQLTGDLAGTQKDLDATKAVLAGARGEFSGAIARTHEELVALARKGDRDYFEFNLARKGSKQKVGNVTVELRKTDAKKNLFTVNLYFDDKTAERKDKAIMEPVSFYIRVRRVRWNWW